MCFYGVDGHTHGVGDLGKLHLVGELHEEDGTLVEGEGGEDAREVGDFLLGDELGLGAGAVGGDEGGYVGDVDGGGAGLTPELELEGALVVADEI